MEASKEFPGFPNDFHAFEVSPIPFDINSKELSLKNHSNRAILFKVKCTNNKRIRIEECSDILKPGNETTATIKKLVDTVDGDSLYVIYTLVGKEWHNERMSAWRCWERAKKQAVPTQCISVPIKRSSECEKKEKKYEKEKTKSED
ncbi:Major sperm protein [Caenorhabditis elegans]|uniref:Major sperm protein n=1 Tax=Caenorhabditis elegans TaxID=6239 RepID=O44550_CAEEL|nr:Major sperm protein [Caenorhabditis elegans]CCD68113.1 Major sperm protein [Caenorhabditis elegans]|eukprot:NP_491860.1 Major sperm protein [Caenorhabditis elegans]